MTSFGLITIATGRYRSFLPGLLSSAQTHLVGLETAFVLSDGPPPVIDGLDIRWLRWGHLAWPFPTLLRHRAITAYAEQFMKMDLLLHIDADMRFVGPVCISCQNLFAVAHPGFGGASRQILPYETDPTSMAYVAAEHGGLYVAGGVQGGQTASYLEACATMAAWVQTDLDRNHVPLWHDESIWNRYVIDHPEALVLPDSHCTPESSADGSTLIVALDKKHSRMRQIPLRQRLHQTALKLHRRLHSLTSKIRG
jgi:hypothetical protein